MWQNIRAIPVINMYYGDPLPENINRHKIYIVPVKAEYYKHTLPVDEE
jgi:hypothetical protein